VTFEPIELEVLAIGELDDDVRKVFARHNVHLIALEVRGDRCCRPTLWAIQRAVVGLCVLSHLPFVTAVVVRKLVAVIGDALAIGTRQDLETVARQCVASITRRAAEEETEE
jgi:hypothetical protein